MRNTFLAACRLTLGLTAILLLGQEAGKEAPSNKTVKGDAAAGRHLFERKCAVCHATDGNQRTLGPGLKGTGKGKLPSGKPAVHDVILKLIDEGGDHTVGQGSGMPVFQDLLTAKEKEDLIAYLVTL